jgi:hypothetical protein
MKKMGVGYTWKSSSHVDTETLSFAVVAAGGVRKHTI